MFDSMEMFEGVMKGFWGSLIEQVTGLVVRLFCGSTRPAPVAETPVPSPTEARLRDALAVLLPRLRSEDDWKRLQRSLEQLGAQFDTAARGQLEGLQQQVVAQVLQPTAAVSRLEQLTADAFRRAGITPQDVAAGQRLAETLSTSTPSDAASSESRRDESRPSQSPPSHSGRGRAAAETVPPPSAPGTQVAETPLPWKWWTLGRDEIDRRTRQVLVARLRAARLACDQASQSLTGLVPLKSLRGIVERLDLVLLQLEGMPPLEMATPDLRLDAFATRSLVRSLDAAAQASTGATTELNRLLAEAPGSAGWNAAHTAVLRELDVVAQQVRERRNLR